MKRYNRMHSRCTISGLSGVYTAHWRDCRQHMKIHHFVFCTMNFCKFESVELKPKLGANAIRNNTNLKRVFHLYPVNCH